MRRRGRSPRLRGFTLVELLVVIFIIVLVSAVTLPVVLPAISHREVSEAARIFQAALVGVRDAAIRAKEPRGLRLLPDPALTIPPLSDPNVGVPGIAGSSMLAYNRFVPLELAPDYLEGKVTIGPQLPSGSTQLPLFPPSYPLGFVGFQDNNYNGTSATNQNGYYPYVDSSYGKAPVLMVEQSVYVGGYIVPTPTNAFLNSPTNWYWNVRIGDKIQIGGDAGNSYTVVGPMVVGPGQGNPDLYVNVGPPGTISPLTRTLFASLAAAALGQTSGTSNPEFLFLVNGQDDDGDGYVDDGWDGINQNTCLNLATDEAIPIQAAALSNCGITSPTILPFGEWETEKWLGPLAQASTTDSTIGSTTSPSFAWMQNSFSNSTQDLPYVISRRPVVSPGARETTLPPTVVIDATSWQSTTERSRLPVDPSTLFVDIVLDPSGQLVPTTVYSSPSSFSMGQTFYHFWLAERQDVHELSDLFGVKSALKTTPPPASAVPNPNPNATATPPQTYLLPMPLGAQGYTQSIVLKGDRRLITLFSRNGVITTHTIENFNVTNTNLPFVEAQLGVVEER
jgi:prepilin-type N-terminal cleavage/methylation domain-containing protein